jgi:hypothetical protein
MHPAAVSQVANPVKPIRIGKSRIVKVKDVIRTWREGIATEIVPPHRVLPEKAISKIANAIKTKEPTEILIRETLEQSGISTKPCRISESISTLVEVIARSLSESVHEQHPPRSPELPWTAPRHPRHCHFSEHQIRSPTKYSEMMTEPSRIASRRSKMSIHDMSNHRQLCSLVYV